MPDHRKLHVDALADMILVFDLSLRQRSSARNAPIDRLLPAVNKSLLNDICEQTKFIGFVFLVQREVRIVPIAKNSQALELRSLQVDIFPRVSIAGSPNCGRIDARVAMLPHLLRNFELDRQAMTIPARNIRSVFAAQSLIADYEILQDLVQCVADVHVAIRERRPIVQNKPFCIGSRFLNPLVKLLCIPLLQSLRFARDQIGFHRKVRLRQIQCILIIH